MGIILLIIKIVVLFNSFDITTIFYQYIKKDLIEIYR